jgi:ferredoxin
MEDKMNLNLLYFSPTGTTEKILESVSGEMDYPVKNTYDLTRSENREKHITFSDEDIVIVGVPVYAGRIPQILLPSFEKIQGKATKAIFIVLYGNRDYDDALLELKNRFEERGFIGIAAGAFIGEHSYTTKVATDRPDQGDLAIAKAFGKEINSKLEQRQENLSELVVKGSFPYKALNAASKLVPTTDDTCIDCGICAKFCPMDAINPLNVKEIDAEKCIRCCSCIKKCPTQSKQFVNENIDKIITMLESNLSNVRKEVELFF